ncbi:glutamate racemase [Curvibacter sp. HBC61]|uniref:Glutamate racemase n=1 Tax=Curvibacter cyanobacteriorum TaxID=3026422 RepID=A0ABT5MXJ7_9BURK|nr:glutamate racemase [Curvibacter sp. HBC61]MDD0838788.1 glutamate racemase [Curvibacter sp. HBC61]
MSHPAAPVQLCADPAASAPGSAPLAEAPIGVFDSGIGGLSVLRALRAALPDEHFIYWADSGFAPYGERGDAFVRERSQRITAHLVAQGAKAVVVACNTATAAAIAELRQAWPQLVWVGVEPALKPAAQASRNGQVLVLATRGTLQSPKFAQLLAQCQAPDRQWHCQPCDGLADAIEQGDEPRIEALCHKYLQAAGAMAPGTGAPIDTVVLGCTHYPLVEDEIQKHLRPGVAVLDTGAPVARHTRRLLTAAGALRTDPEGPGTVRWLTSGDPAQLSAAVQRWWPGGLGACDHAPVQVAPGAGR